MWFTEDAWAPIIVCVLLAAFSFVGAMILQRPKVMIAAVVFTLMAVVTFFVERAIVTDSERLEATLEDLVDTFVRESQQTPKTAEPTCVRFFAARNNHDRTRIAAAVALVKVEDVRITDVQIKLTNQNTRAISLFRANGVVRIGTDGGHYPTRWELNWQKEANEWKITQTRMLNSVNGDEIPIPRVDR